MPYTVTNTTNGEKPYRDNDGKRFLGAGETTFLTGDQHAPMLRDAGFEVVFVQSHRDIVAAAEAEDAAADTVEAKPGRKATVTVKDK